MLYPLKLQPIYKDYIWGGQKLKERFDKQTTSSNTAESWEIASHKNGESTVSNGKLQGKTLTKIIDIYGLDILGTKVEEQSVKKFPLLIKLLDAADNLSVQVHPDDEYAFENENGELGKTEMWYVIDAEPGAQIVYGVKAGVSKEEFKEAIFNGDVKKHLNFVDVNAGDVFFVPAKMLHALGKGILVAEIQQNSDTTYRVYDWDRLGDDGMPRQLHVDKALDVIDFSDVVGQEKVKGLKVYEGKNIRTNLVSCKYFKTQKVEVKGASKERLTGEIFNIIMIIEGSGCIEYNNSLKKKKREEFKAGDTFLIPASIGDYKITGNCDIIKCYIP